VVPVNWRNIAVTLQTPQALMPGYNNYACKSSVWQIQIVAPVTLLQTRKRSHYLPSEADYKTSLVWTWFGHSYCYAFSGKGDNRAHDSAGGGLVRIDGSRVAPCYLEDVVVVGSVGETQ
jgi:hypothetical protein